MPIPTPAVRATASRLDHVVPRCLDGSNDLSNLQLQPWPEAEAKDHREAEICRAYCSGTISLEQARELVSPGMAVNRNGRKKLVVQIKRLVPGLEAPSRPSAEVRLNPRLVPKPVLPSVTR